MPEIAVVIIGRNEGARLVACLASVEGAARVVYVDSGSTDGSVAAARGAGAEVVSLDMSQPFTAARARNAGLALLDASTPYVQFIDGDCAMRDGWLVSATAYLDANPTCAVVCGRRRERHPEASVYNRLCDIEWDTPVGPAKACGGDALMRLDAVQAAGGYRADLIAGEEPELCLRLRSVGWTVMRLDAEMTWHDADITRFGQWWQRTRRAGHAYAEGAALHGAGPDRHWVRATSRALIWGAVLPVVALVATVAVPFGGLVWLVYPAQVLRLWRRSGDTALAFFTVLGKLPEAVGALGFYMGRMTGKRRGLVEYK